MFFSDVFQGSRWSSKQWMVVKTVPAVETAALTTPTRSPAVVVFGNHNSRIITNDFFILDSHPEVDSMLNVEPQKHSHLSEVCLKVQLFIYSDYTYKMRVQHNLTINNRGLYFRIGMMMDNADLTINNT
jgi:hypothetical protein